MLSCPRCGADTMVVRSLDDYRTVVRLRECKRCSHRFTTTELMNTEMNGFIEALSRTHMQEEQT
ncbi:NrdR family transcriptional regulator [Desulfobaculum senezii]